MYLLLLSSSTAQTAAAAECICTYMYACMRACMKELVGQQHSLAGQANLRILHLRRVCRPQYESLHTVTREAHLRLQQVDGLPFTLVSRYQYGRVDGAQAIIRRNVRRLTSRIWKPHSPTKNSLRMSRCNSSRLSALRILDATAVHCAQIQQRPRQSGDTRNCSCLPRCAFDVHSWVRGSVHRFCSRV